MKRTSALIFITAILLTVLGGCKNSNSNTDETSTFTDTQTVTSEKKQGKSAGGFLL